MAMRVCIEVGCSKLTRTTRCTDHSRSKDRARGTASRRGYDAAYERAKRAPEYVNATSCTICGEVFTTENPKTAGHVIAIRKGGKGGPIEAQCRRCNYGWLRTDT